MKIKQRSKKDLDIAVLIKTKYVTKKLKTSRYKYTFYFVKKKKVVYKLINYKHFFFTLIISVYWNDLIWKNTRLNSEPNYTNHLEVRVCTSYFFPELKNETIIFKLFDILFWMNILYTSFR